MSDFVESAKNFVNSAVSRTSWEAQKQMRVRGKQSEVDQLLKQRQQLLDDLAQVAMTLYQQGALTDPRLSRLCASVQELDSDVRNREGQLQDLKNEPYPTEQFAPAPTTNYTPPSTGYSQPSSQPGHPSSAGSPPPSPAYTAGSAQQQPCPTCKQPVRAGALYCRNCGTKMR
ncbi:MAG: zinc ribbon domain-containing protein [Chloroflexota bacterium]|nr:zinc ribbon domain-containing protein [Chloroflexota bacterium]